MPPRLDLPFSGKRLRRIRVNARLTQEELAQLCTSKGTPVSRFQIARAESDKYKPSPDTLDALTTALDCSVDDLLTPGEGVRQESA
jgi:transcriptional regulator with XRE-family HTH domain